MSGESGKMNIKQLLWGVRFFACGGLASMAGYALANLEGVMSESILPIIVMGIGTVAMVIGALILLVFLFKYMCSYLATAKANSLKSKQERQAERKDK